MKFWQGFVSARIFQEMPISAPASLFPNKCIVSLLFELIY